MCGILFIASGLEVASGGGSVHAGPPAASPSTADFEEGLACRGPDCQGACSVDCSPARLHFRGSLLQLRGAAPACTPVCDAAGNVLLFNGQVFGGSLHVPPAANDAALLFQALAAPSADVPAILGGVHGPWAAVFWQAATRTLWFGRDAFGRRSLLLHLPRAADGRFMLASSASLHPEAPFVGWQELPPGLYSLALPPAVHSTADGGGAADAVAAAAAAAAAAAGVECFDGGVGQSAVLLRAAHRQHDWPDPAVRQLAAFWRAPELVEPPAAVAEPPAAAAAADGAAAAVGCSVVGDAAAVAGAAGAGAAAAAQFEATVDALLEALRQAVATRCRCIEERRQQQQPTTSQHERSPQEQARAPRPLPPPAPTLPLPPPAPVLPLLPPATVLILFSGGLDSTLLAALAHEALPPDVPIDLASICFDGGVSPDRQSALDALQELRALAPLRQWRLIQVDCTLADVEAAKQRLLRLLAPADTVMDLNIGAALWLAARGEGRLLLAGGGADAAGTEGRLAEQRQQEQRQAGQQPPLPLQQQQQHRSPARPSEAPSLEAPSPVYRSAARVVLLGHGADELCAGYGRHRTVFRARGWAGLGEELALDLRRLWLRNLGRDDRLVADHGREARHPYLDERSVSATLAAPLWHLADLRAPPGEGDKRALRACARRLGLHRAAGRIKRAIQFGTRLAAKANTAQFGGTRRANLASAGSVRLADVPLRGLGDPRGAEAAAAEAAAAAAAEPAAAAGQAAGQQAAAPQLGGAAQAAGAEQAAAALAAATVRA
ncbi:asparagine synthetase domain-containing 1 [Micractinium conductrix]|uniref:Asparagine synthetase domain-containing 1 n=1 Tax=Micractinium conductrix TaxID=554055 RepID=A0A2P6V804_9CHLO|nr:asparagine synthetase domain-containing 1 [Micractinium conductrix]|eukprot:PSC70217.1 asparagine synthetase domain-containing 1 [Micractinium conductrix]